MASSLERETVGRGRWRCTEDATSSPHATLSTTSMSKLATVGDIFIARNGDGASATRPHHQPCCAVRCTRQTRTWRRRRSRGGGRAAARIAMSAERRGNGIRPGSDWRCQKRMCSLVGPLHARQHDCAGSCILPAALRGGGAPSARGKGSKVRTKPLRKLMRR